MKAIVNPHWSAVPLDKVSQLRSYADKLSNGSWSHSHEIEDLLTKINSATHVDQLPTKVIVSYKSLLQRNVNPYDVVDVINLSAKIASNRLGVAFNEIIFTGTAIDKIDADYHRRLSSAGFRGCSISPFIYGLDAALSTTSSDLTDDWHGMVISKPTTVHSEFDDLKISLTYRQYQIANLICQRGLTNHQIAKQLDISDSTVKMHIGIILKKYGVQHRTQLIVAMQEKTVR
jgi:DNA-binding CsgD family transcriptional regulator